MSKQYLLQSWLYNVDICVEAYAMSCHLRCSPRVLPQPVTQNSPRHKLNALHLLLLSVILLQQLWKQVKQRDKKRETGFALLKKVFTTSCFNRLVFQYGNTYTHTHVPEETRMNTICQHQSQCTITMIQVKFLKQTKKHNCETFPHTS